MTTQPPSTASISDFLERHHTEGLENFIVEYNGTLMDAESLMLPFEDLLMGSSNGAMIKLKPTVSYLACQDFLQC